MALDRQIVRLAKILVDSQNISFDEAQDKLRALTLEIVVGAEATSPAAHAAVLTAVSVASRTFVGGVRVTGEIDGPLNSAIPLNAGSVAEGAASVGASVFDGVPSRSIQVSTGEVSAESWSVSPWWNGWRAGTAKPGEARWDIGTNPLPGIAAGALAVGAAFDAERGSSGSVGDEISLWPVGAGKIAPPFTEVLLPQALWLVGLGNLGQAYLWTLSALPYIDPSKVSLVLHDRDRITEENWATSVLVQTDTYGVFKTKVAEQWALSKGFDARRIDRRLLAGDRLERDDPRLALSGVDKIESRKLMANVGFDGIVDAGLGHISSDFDRYRVTVFDRIRPIDMHFTGQEDKRPGDNVPTGEAYRRLEEEIGACGTAEIGGASVAAPYVSAVTSAVAISRAIAIASGCECPANEVGRLSFLAGRKISSFTKVVGRGIRHAGTPNVRAYCEPRRKVTI